MIAHLNPITPGELYSQDKLTDLQSRLQDSGYFRSVFATIETDVAHAELVPVRVDLTELEQRRLSLGAGYSTDVGARLQARWLDRKFLGHNWLLESALQLDRVTPSLGADLSFPALEGQYLNGWRPSLGAHIARSDISNDVIDKFRFDARYTGPDKRNERTIGLSFLTERERLPNVDPNNRQALVATWSLTRRRLDRLISPTEGYVAALEAAAGPRGLFNEANLARLAARANWLLPLTPDWQLQLRGQLGQVYGAARERIPSDLLFLTGGDTSVRGYAYNTLGVARDTAVVGGRVLAVMSAELTHWLTPKYGAAIFQDAGDAADSWGELKLKRSTGIGARLRTPIGPVNLDLAYGQATHATRLHFSVGYGF
jgi:translocation and assembly module TamA